MARYFLSTLMLLLLSLYCRSASNDVGKEFYRLRNTDNKTLLDKGYECTEKAKYDSAMIYYSMVVNRYYANSYAKKDLPDIAKAMHNLGIIYMTFSYDYKKSYEYLLEAKEIAENNKFYGRLPNIYNSIANILQISNERANSKNETEVMDMLRKSFNMALKLKDYQTLAFVMDNLVALSFEKDRSINGISKEIRQFRKACSGSKKGEIPQALLLCSAYEAYIRNDNAKAIEILEYSKQTVVNNSLSYRSVLSSQGMITEIYKKAKQYDKVIASINTALDIARKNNSLDYITTLYRELSAVYRKKGNIVMADKYELEYFRCEEKLQGEAQLSSVKNVKFMHELDKANEQVRVLSAKRRTQNLLLAIALVVMCIITALLYRLYRANRKINQNYRFLYRSNVELLAKDNEVRSQREDAERRIGELEEKLREYANTAVATGQQSAAIENATSRQKYQNSRLTDTDTKDLYTTVQRVMESSSEIYKLGFNINTLSELVHSRSRYVSQAINQESGSNFNSLLNEYRIKEACRRLNDNQDYANMTIEGIAESVGFKSRTSFGALFKSITGLSPSAYQKMARKQ